MITRSSYPIHSMSPGIHTLAFWFQSFLSSYLMGMRWEFIHRLISRGICLGIH
nr:hypothetical protein Iba_chr01bCG0010 [Ipomoea batatas]GMC55089.1 hypothetical protein Iba_chr01eCG4140 [Ipomoea batatas]